MKKLKKCTTDVKREDGMIEVVDMMIDMIVMRNHMIVLEGMVDIMIVVEMMEEEEDTVRERRETSASCVRSR